MPKSWPTECNTHLEAAAKFAGPECFILNISAALCEDLFQLLDCPPSPTRFLIAFTAPNVVDNRRKFETRFFAAKTHWSDCSFETHMKSDLVIIVVTWWNWYHVRLALFGENSTDLRILSRVFIRHELVKFRSAKSVRYKEVFYVISDFKEGVRGECYNLKLASVSSEQYYDQPGRRQDPLWWMQYERSLSRSSPPLCHSDRLRDSENGKLKTKYTQVH